MENWQNNSLLNKEFLPLQEAEEEVLRHLPAWARPTTCRPGQSPEMMFGQ